MYGVSSQVAPYAGLAPEGQLITRNNTSRLSSHVWSLVTSRTIRWTGSRGAVHHPEQHIQTYHHMYGVSSPVAPYAGLAPEGQLITRNNTSRLSSHVWSLVTGRTIRWTGSRGAVHHPEQHIQTYHHMYGVSSPVAPYAGLAPEGQFITRNNTSRHIITCMESRHQSHHTLDWLQRGS